MRIITETIEAIKTFWKLPLTRKVIYTLGTAPMWVGALYIAYCCLTGDF